MKRFILNTSLYLLLVLILLTVFDVLGSQYIRKNAIFKVKESTSIIIMGHSHPECAFNDSIINFTQNCSESGESYFYTYQKLKNILANYPQIQTILIEFEQKQFYNGSDEWIWGTNSLIYRYPKYYPFLNHKEKLMLFIKNPISSINSFSLSAQDAFTRIFEGDFDFTNQLGGYKYLNQQYQAINKDTINIPSQNFFPSETNLTYLYKAIDLCEKLKKRVVLIRSPLLNNQLKKDVNQIPLMEIVAEKYHHIKFLDFSKHPLTLESFADSEHLNNIGAKKFSHWFNESVISELLEHQNN